jgi:hypothetical protein
MAWQGLLLHCTSRLWGSFELVNLGLVLIWASRTSFIQGAYSFADKKTCR